MIQTVLADYEVIDGEEIIPTSAIVNPWCEQHAYHVDDATVLRTETTSDTFAAAADREPPVRVLAAGRVFRADSEEDASHQKVFHQADLLCMEASADLDALHATLGRLFSTVLGSTELRYDEATFHWFEYCKEVVVRLGGAWERVGGCGVMTADTVRHFGCDPGQVGGFAAGMGLERLTMLRLGIDDIRELWQPPHVPE